MPRFAASLVAVRNTPGVNRIRHAAAVIDAASEDEALGIAYKLCRHAYPANEHYEGHHVTLTGIENVVPPQAQWGNLTFTPGV